MDSMVSVLRWSWLLAVALLAPVALPAGGAQLSQPEIRRGDHLGPLLSSSGCVLRVCPLAVAPSLRSLHVGTPMRVIRRWQSGEGGDWLHVQIGHGVSGHGGSDQGSSGQGAAEVGATRGWVSV